MSSVTPHEVNASIERLIRAERPRPIIHSLPSMDYTLEERVIQAPTGEMVGKVRELEAHLFGRIRHPAQAIAYFVSFQEDNPSRQTRIWLPVWMKGEPQLNELVQTYGDGPFRSWGLARDYFTDPSANREQLMPLVVEKLGRFSLQS